MKVGEILLRDGLTDASLLEYFKNAEKAIIEIIEKADPDSPYRSYRYQQRVAIERVIRRLEEKIGTWTGKHIPDLVKAGAKEMAEQIRSFDEKEFSLKFAGVNETAVSLLADSALADFGNTIVALKRNAQRASFDKKKLNDKIIEGVIQGSSVYRTQKQLLDALKQKGITVLKTRNGLGRRISVETYTNTLVRSQSIAAYSNGARLQMLGMGRRYAKIPKLRPDIDGPDVCNIYENQVYIDLKDPKQVPPWHPNCRHVPQAVSFAELKANSPDLYRIAVAEFKRANE
jgi:hypothetical protein